MNVTINRAEMLSAIKRASAIAPADSPLDVLRGALLEADAAAGKLTVTSTNLEAALEEKLPCTVQEDGALVFGAKMLAEMLSRLPQDTVQLCRAENQGRMTLRSGDACYEVDVWERGAFPKPDLPFPEDTVKLSGIPAMAQHTVFATAQDNSKPLLKCVNLMFTSTGLRAAGSNGNCIVTARGDNQSTGDVSLLIPAASLGKLSNMCQDKDEFRVGTTGKSIVFFRENFLFSARLMEGGYIDTDQLVGSMEGGCLDELDIRELLKHDQPFRDMWDAVGSDARIAVQQYRFRGGKQGEELGDENHFALMRAYDRALSDEDGSTFVERDDVDWLDDFELTKDDLADGK